MKDKTSTQKMESGHWPASVKKKIFDRFEAGLGYKAASRDLNVPVTTVRTWFMNWKVGCFSLQERRERNRYPMFIRNEALRLCSLGKSRTEISTELKVPRGTVAKWINRYGTTQTGPESNPLSTNTAYGLSPFSPAGSEPCNSSHGDNFFRKLARGAKISWNPVDLQLTDCLEIKKALAVDMCLNKYEIDHISKCLDVDVSDIKKWFGIYRSIRKRLRTKA